MVCPQGPSIRASWRTWSRAGWRDVNAGRRVAASRSQIIEALASDGVLWPLVDEGPSCVRCASPRQKMAAGRAAECRGCRMLAKAYAGPLADVHPITYTAPRWRLCVGVRVLKDGPCRPAGQRAGAQHRCDPLRLPRASPRWPAAWSHARIGVVTTVPSSRPVMAGALRRATLEGWWSTEPAVVATARPGHARQRQARTRSACTCAVSGRSTGRR
jgi:hypothetical protein